MADAIRSQRLQRLLQAVADGKKALSRVDEAKNFLEAICLQDDPVQSASMLTRKRPALSALKQAILMDLSEGFLNGLGARLIRYILDDKVHSLNSGQLTYDLLVNILDPPLLWDAFKSAEEQKSLDQEGLLAFGSLVLDALRFLPLTSQLREELDVETSARSIWPTLVQYEDRAIRNLGSRLGELLQSSSTYAQGSGGNMVLKAGGRHDNDFEDFRRIAIFPTADELMAKEEPFYRTADEVFQCDPNDRIAAHLDNQFRLYKEDFTAELKQELQTMSTSDGRKKARSRLRIHGLQLTGINAGSTTRLRRPTIAMRCWDIAFRKISEDEETRRAHFAKNKNFPRHGSLGCLMHKSTMLAFATIERDEDQLAKVPSVLLFSVFGKEPLRKTLMSLKSASPRDVEFLSMDTAFYAYEPVLTRLQQMKSLPLAEDLLGLIDGMEASQSCIGLEHLANRVADAQGHDLQELLNVPKAVVLDKSQTASFVAGLNQAVSLIQGPPGTGKSFLGSLLAKAFLDHTDETILVLCYTNHALDQFLEDILDMDVTEEHMVRLGSKSTLRTQSLGLFEQTKHVRVPHRDFLLQKSYKEQAIEAAKQAEYQGESFSRWNLNDQDLLDCLEFSENDTPFFHAFTVPQGSEGMTIVGFNGKPLDELYLIDRWRNGKDAGALKESVGQENPKVWGMDKSARTEHIKRWTREATEDRVQVLCSELANCDREFDRWLPYRDGKAAELIRGKRIICCTTTAASKYSSLIGDARPGIVLVEEAGEVLESHILTALRPETKQLVMIGDHLQLRPKIGNYRLSVESANGYDLNRSLFERLVLDGYPHAVLNKQHRMRPEISALVKRLTYPTLEDGDRTKSRENIRGLQSNVVFISHEQLETASDKDSAQIGVDGYKQSRSNVHEAKLVLKIVRYLGQQGYGTDRQVVLTPYLGQLRLLMDQLQAEHDPVLNDLDSHELIRAGLIPPSRAGMGKRQLRLSTIDNFQGEESDIVIVTLTRSNRDGDIGFLNQPQRLNVLLSRARDGLIMIGNPKTFRASKKGCAFWEPFFEQLRQAGQLHDGLPVKCERHPSRALTLKSEDDFDVHSPNGGCDQPCGAILQCGQHECPEKCHQIFDHSKMQCQIIMQSQCTQGHKETRRCWEQARQCHTCQRQAEEVRAKQERDLKLVTKREELEQAYLLKLNLYDDQIADKQRILQDHDDEKNREQILEQKKRDLAQISILAQRAGDTKAETSRVSAPSEGQQVNDQGEPDYYSEAAKAWAFQKNFENADNEHIDALIGMIGLENVKQRVLDVKTRVDTALRQGASLDGERWGATLIGNPGTGKTTVARLYAKCLASMGAVAGHTVEEITASKLANGGPAALQKLVDKVLQAGGGAIFIDEAYQLSAGSHAAGSSILDSLLDEVENQRAKIVFLLAGYKKEMEGLLAHNPGLPSRFPHELVFEDYEDSELLKILSQQISRHFNDHMKLENGQEGLYSRIAVRRVGRGRGRPGFGNARAMENTFAAIRTRQARRLAKARTQGEKCDDFYFTKEDLIGPEPSNALEVSTAWKKLQQLTGLNEVKNSVRALVQSVTYNYERELREEPLLDFNLNKVFLGSPGTGKTTVAKLYGQVLADMGLLSNGQVVLKNPSDFVGDALGVSERNTRGILASTVGKVLVIDEAYGLHTPSGGSGQSHDPYKSSVVDTLVAEIQSVPGEDRCVLLLGYKPQMEAMFQCVNPGLSRRFPMSEAFIFEDFTEDEMKSILELKLKQQGYTVTDPAMQATMESLQRARNKPNFGNAGEIDILLNGAKARHQRRQTSNDSGHDTILQAVDIDPEFDRSRRKEVSVRGLFQGTLGAEKVISRLEGIQKAALNMRLRGLDSKDAVPFNFLFVGPPGTGKTTTARKMGSLYYDIGILSTKEVVEVSATDLIGEYVGHTGPKTQKLLENALGKVMFIDEAYRLAEGHFAKEAMDELVDRLTKPQFAKRLVVILAGYSNDMARLMSINPGLTSRFPESISFDSLRPPDCLDLLLACLRQKPFLDVAGLEALDANDTHNIMSRFQTLITIDDWANARDVGTLASNIANTKLEYAEIGSQDKMIVTFTDVINGLESMIEQRRKLERKPSLVESLTAQSNLNLPQQSEPTLSTSQHNLSSHQNFASTNPEQPTPQLLDEAPEEGVSVVQDQEIEETTNPRDAGVPDAIWSALQLDKDKAEDEEKVYDDVVARMTMIEKEKSEDELFETAPEGQIGVEAVQSSDDEERRRSEQERILRETLRRQQDEERERLRMEKERIEAARREEQKAQQKLREMGVCLAGYRWIKQSTGYRCAGGSHFVSNEALQSGHC